MKIQLIRLISFLFCMLLLNTAFNQVDVKDLIKKEVDGKTLFYYKGKPYTGKGSSFRKDVLEVELNYVDGLLHGDIIQYRETGYYKRTATYVEGKLHGKMIKYGFVNDHHHVTEYDQDVWVSRIEYSSNRFLESYTFRLGESYKNWAEIHTYNRHGRITSVMTFDPGEKQSITSHAMDSDLLFSQAGMSPSRSPCSSGNQTQVIESGKTSPKLSGEYELYHDNGQLHKKGNCEEGIKSGPWLVYYNDGQLKLKGNYVKGQVEGELLMYYPNGKLMLKSNSSNGLLTGEVSDYYDNGQAQYVGDFEAGKMVGEHLQYHPLGQIKSKTTYLKGVPVGKKETFFENGNIKTECMFLDGHPNDTTDVTYYMSGQVESKKFLIENEGKRPSPRLVFYYETGSMKSSTTFNRGKASEIMEYYENGQIKIKKYGYPYYNSGIFNLEGESQEYYENAQLKIIGSYKSNKPKGDWKYYSESGQLNTTLSFEPQYGPVKCEGDCDEWKSKIKTALEQKKIDEKEQKERDKEYNSYEGAE